MARLATLRMWEQHVGLQICARVQEAEALSPQGIQKQRDSQQKLLKCLDEFIESCTPGSVQDPVKQVDVPVPAKRMLFDGLSLSHIDGWAYTQTPAPTK